LVAWIEGQIGRSVALIFIVHPLPPVDGRPGGDRDERWKRFQQWN
jgi:hypothetical protein